MAGSRCIKSSFNHHRLSSLVFPFLLALVVLSIDSCTKEEAKEDYEIRNYVASILTETKTSLVQDGVVNWSEGDWIWYYSKDGGLLRMFTVEKDSPKADLQLNVASTANYLIAVHGAGSISDYTGASLTLHDVVEPIQDGTFSSHGHVTIARLDDVTAQAIAFHNLTSFISFSTAINDIDHIVFSATDGTALHGNGDVRVSFESGMPVGTITGGSSSIMVELSGAGTYYIAMLPTILQSGFTIECYNADGLKIGTAVGRKGLEVKMSSVFRLGSIDSHLSDEKGVKLVGYGNDADWDDVIRPGVDINRGNYGSDYNWNEVSAAGGNINKGGYGDDENWDGGSGSGSTVGNSGYGNDANWDNG